MTQTTNNFQVVRIDNGIRNPHTGAVRSFGSARAALDFIDSENRKLRRGKSPMSLPRHPYAVLNAATGEISDCYSDVERW